MNFRLPDQDPTDGLLDTEDVAVVGNEDNSAVISTLRSGAAFAGLRYFDNALWAGGAALGLYVQSKYGLPAVTVAPPVAASVTAIDYAVSGVALDVFKDTSGAHDDKDGEILEQVAKRSGKIGKEVAGLAYAAWAGSTSAIEVNNTLGLESHPTRRLGQAAVFGVGVSLWTTDIPPFGGLRDAAQDYIRYSVENPVEGVSYGVGLSLGIFGLLKIYNVARDKFRQRRSTDSNQSAE